MKHKVEIAPNLAMYIDDKRVIGTKPHGSFSTTEMIVSDEDLKRLSDRCLEVIADTMQMESERTMSLDEAINHCEDVAVRHRLNFDLCPSAHLVWTHNPIELCDGATDCRILEHGKDKGCLKCAKEHDQLAKWLRELKAYREIYYRFNDIIPQPERNK